MRNPHNTVGQPCRRSRERAPGAGSVLGRDLANSDNTRFTGSHSTRSRSGTVTRSAIDPNQLGRWVSISSPGRSSIAKVAVRS